uniref:C-type lectin domain-containing protein n=1 Tax=Panagrolaimus sp. ES5 TaxID=591445 RepID=A0AC34FE31_9BILA
MLILCFLLLIAFQVNASACPSGSVEWNSNCYIFQKNATEFAAAEIACKNLSGNLVSVHDAFTNALLAGEAPNYFQLSNESDFWIGGTLLMHAGNWSWIDNSPFDFNDWNKGEPQNFSSNGCVSVSISSGAWSSQDCFKSKPYVCNVTPKPTNPPFVNCSFGWSYFEPSSSCYGVGNVTHEKIPWEDAENRCQAQGAHLVSIHSYEEYNFVKSYDVYAWAGPIWTGLRSDDGGNTWKYSDNTPFDYPFWKSGTNTTQDGCVVSSIYWLAVNPCNVECLFLCKKSAV